MKNTFLLEKMRRKFAVTVLSIAHLLRAIDALLPQRLELQTAPSRTLPNALSMITPAPVVRKQNLLERATPETCGYVSGNPGRILYQSPLLGAKTAAASPLTCPQSYSCTSTMLFAAAWACCNQIQCLGAYRTCANYGDDICMGLEDAVCSGIYTSYLSW